MVFVALGVSGDGVDGTSGYSGKEANTEEVFLLFRYVGGILTSMLLLLVVGVLLHLDFGFAEVGVTLMS